MNKNKFLGVTLSFVIISGTGFVLSEFLLYRIVDFYVKSMFFPDLIVKYKKYAQYIIFCDAFISEILLRLPLILGYMVGSILATFCRIKFYDFSPWIIVLFLQLLYEFAAPPYFYFGFLRNIVYPQIWLKIFIVVWAMCLDIFSAYLSHKISFFVTSKLKNGNDK